MTPRRVGQDVSRTHNGADPRLVLLTGIDPVPTPWKGVDLASNLEERIRCKSLRCWVFRSESVLCYLIPWRSVAVPDFYLTNSVPLVSCWNWRPLWNCTTIDSERCCSYSNSSGPPLTLQSTWELTMIPRTEGHKKVWRQLISSQLVIRVPESYFLSYTVRHTVTFLGVTTVKIGGCPRSRTANVYHMGPDLQSGVEHAISTRHP